jgi:hypothetical protein
VSHRKHKEATVKRTVLIVAKKAKKERRKTPSRISVEAVLKK